LTARLNVADRFMQVIDQTIRGLGGPGFDTVTFVWLDGRADRDQLRRGLQQVNRVSPGVTARLQPDVPCWEFRPNAEVELHEVELPVGDDRAVLDYAAGLLAGTTDPATVDPMRFHLLHRPDGTDVLLVQYNHVLLDHAHAVSAIRSLDEPFRPYGDKPPGLSQENVTNPEVCHHMGTSSGAPPTPWCDPVWAHLRRVPREIRHRAGRAAEAWGRTLRGGAVKLGRPANGDPGGPRYGIVTRALSAEEVQRLDARVRRAAGMPHLSMALLASALRGIDRLTADRSDRGRYFQVGLPLDLGLKDRPPGVLENLSTLVPLRVPPASAADRDELLRELARQLRGALTDRVDIGILELITQFGRRRHRAAWAMDALMRHTLSLWYSYLGPMRLGPTFLGRGVTDAFSAGPTWPAVGVTLLASQFAGRLRLQLTYMPHSVPAPLATAYLDQVVADLLAEAG
jgi:hypothetical protein